MSERVVYFTGAGFSAPLGLPVMGDFLFKSKDMYSSNPEKYSHFKDIFSEIDKIAVTKNYYSADLFNIEEILSILEMRSQMDALPLKDSFIRYLCNVVSYHTPEFARPAAGRPAPDLGVHPFLAHLNPPHRAIANFVANILNLSVRELPLREQENRSFQSRLNPKSSVHYAVITVNYDMVLEQAVNLFARGSVHPFNSPPLRFADSSAGMDPWANVTLVKLHGSVDKRDIVPPTWSKGVGEAIVDAWRAAHLLLREATQIRILGYSMPVADSYVKYLFKAAAAESRHLKAIDVICLDPLGQVKKRYEDFVAFRDMRFRNADLMEYFKLAEKPRDYFLSLPRDDCHFDDLEAAHQNFM